MFMEENLAEFELNRSPVGSLPDLLDPMAELSRICYAHKCPKMRSGKEVSRVEFYLSLSPMQVYNSSSHLKKNATSP
jgi:hypothetical protein